MFLAARRTSYTSTARHWLFSPCFTWFPALVLLLLSWGHIFWEKYEYSELDFYVLCCQLGVCESCELLHESPGFICCEGSRVKIAGSPRDHPLQSLDHPTAPHGCDRAGIARSPPGVGPLLASADLRSIALMTSCGHRTAIAGSPFDDLRIFSATFRTVAPRLPLDDRTVSHGPPPDEEKWGGIGRSSSKF